MLWVMVLTNAPTKPDELLTAISGDDSAVRAQASTIRQQPFGTTRWHG